jgi:tetratricopeptide (TPR) repeat protein
LLVLGALTYRQVSYWRDIPSFWQRTSALTQDNYVAQDQLGIFLFTHGHTEEASTHFRTALAIMPDDLLASMYLAPYEQSRGNLLAASGMYQVVIRQSGNPSFRATAYHNLGLIDRQIGNSTEAKQCFEAELQLTPEPLTTDRSLAMVELGLIAEQTGDLSEAVRQFSRAVAVQPNDVGFLLLTHALQIQGHDDQARAIAERVARTSPNLPEAQQQAAALLSGK